MFLRITEEENLHPWKTKYGKPFMKKIKVKICHLKCDSCKKEFRRKHSQMSPSRMNDNFKHFCDDCKDPSLFADLGREVIRQNLDERVGEKRIDQNGYVQVRVASDYVGSGLYGGAVREHILVMENHIGRQIEKGEVVHHIDGDKTNNNIKNLQLMTVAEHNACHAANDRLVMELFRSGVVGYDRKTKRYFVKE